MSWFKQKTGENSEQDQREEEPRRKFHISPELRHRIWRDSMFELPILIGANVVLYLLWKMGGYVLIIDPQTQHYLYSSLMQAFATLSGLMLTLMVFLYQRIKDGQTAYLEDASREAAYLSMPNLSRDYDTIKSKVEEWEKKSHASQKEKVKGLIARVILEHRAADDPESRELSLRHETEQLGSDVGHYSQIASLLGRVKLLDKYFRTQMSVGSILAAVSTLAIVLLSLGLLASVGHLRDIHAFAVLTTAILAVFSAKYVFEFFRDVLYVTFGISRIPGFKETGLKDPKEAVTIIKEVDKEMRWQHVY